MPNKALTIDVHSDATPTGKLDSWSQLENISIFIDNIQTPPLSADTNIGQLVSGIPSAFARVDLFKTAIEHVANGGGSKAEKSNLEAYYRQLVQEWRGLIACMALDYAHISVRRIDLQYSDGKPLNKTANIYEPKGAFGNMLLKRAACWREQNLPNNSVAVPYINVIKYRGQVVGATSPESLLFTSSGYKAEPSNDRPWISKDGKFVDPLHSNIDPGHVATLHAYVSHILKGLGDMNAYFANLPKGVSVDYTSIIKELSKWQQELADKAEAEDFPLSIGSTPPVSAGFTGPFQKLFCHKDILYGVEGIISETAESPGAVEFDPKNLLLDESAKIARISLRVRPEDMPNLPILVLTANIRGTNEKEYFALPLSGQGLNVYGKNLAALVGMSAGTSAITSSLKATYDPSLRTDNLEVVLTITTSSGAQRSFKKVYSTSYEIANKDILIWPNFVSPQWDAYYMYSELPHNGTSQQYRAFPFVGEMQDNYFRILVDEDQQPVLLGKDGHINVSTQRIKAELLVQSDDAVADNPYKYEIYQSNRPFKGVRLLAPTGNEGGYIMVNYSSSPGTQLPRDMMRHGDTPQLQPVRLGIDFGSTNTSIAYSSDSTQECGFVFSNQRVSLFGNELPNYPIVPKENQVFFFQGAGPDVKSNSIKSVLTLHDPRRLPPLQSGETPKMRNQKAVVGGFPCFADNLPFFHSSPKTITLKFPGVGEVTQIHNMKWEDTDEDKAHKSAFLRTLMLQTYAALFANGFVPTSLKWSYPSAMMGQLMISYQTIWQSLGDISPVLDVSGSRYKLEVSRYIDSRSLGSPMDEGGFGSQNAFGGDGFGGNSGDGFGSDGGFGSDFGGGFGGGFGGDFGGSGSDLGNKAFSDEGGSGFGSDGGFGGSFGGGFGDPFGGSSQSQPADSDNFDLMPDSNEGEIEYKPERIYTDPALSPSLSEAEAVANFVSTRYATQANVLNLCFDVGGSTCDISALFYLSNGITMIKQNSLRFAAQRVSQAVGRFPSFKNVLKEICAQYDIRMVGLNMGKESYNESTAPYFFDQIVNRLDESQLPNLYERIAADCKQLMCVNLYVTGLLMFYAGEISHKLVDDLMRATPEEWPTKRRPHVRVTFAGKGSRLFQWLKSVHPAAARQYYGNMFVRGYGEQHLKETLAGWQEIVLPDVTDPDIKYEVSKGLAKGDTSLQRPTVKQPSEIIGESGFELVGNDHKSRPVDFTNSITPEMMKNIGVRFISNNSQTPAPRFTDFCGFFYKAARQLFNWQANPASLESACRNLNITAYAQNMPEYRTADRESKQGHEQFSFVAPIIILEGMKFYDDTLLNLLKP